jgi:hypothetical protein
MLRLNGGPDYNPEIERLLAAASSTMKKPTFKINLIGSDRLRGASYISKKERKRKKLYD